MSAVEFRALAPEDVEVRVGTCRDDGVSLLLYKTSRTDMALLDETVGPENWQADYRSIDGKLFCGIGCRFGDGEWVWKWSNGTPSNMEAAKGEASDAMKRAGFMWGVGRELYTAPFIWVGADMCNVKQGRNGRPQCYDDFRVTEMSVEGGRIVKLVVANMSRRGAVVYGEGRDRATVRDDDPVKAAKARLWEALKGYAGRHGRTPEEILEGVRKRPEWESQGGSAEWLESVAREFEEADG